MIKLRTPPALTIERPGGEKVNILLYGTLAAHFLREFRRAIGAGDKSFDEFCKIFDSGDIPEPDPIDVCAAVKVLLPDDLLNENGEPALGLPECRDLFSEAARVVLQALTEGGGTAEKK